MRLRDRLEKLEERDAPSVTRWHWLISEPGQSQGEAVAAYEATNGPIPGTDSIICWNVVPA